ncbi:MAG: cyclic peptide export ABC transporter [Ekhidna sp.]|nr:cyclic peptide export ABC transporter [Ekhidna sp.]
MRVIYFLLKSSLKQVFISALASVLAALLSIGAIRSINQIIASTEKDDLSELWSMCGMVIGSALLSIIAGHIITQHFEFKISGIREALSEGILKSSFEKIERNRERIVPSLLNDIITLGNFSRNLPDFIVSSITVIAIWIYMFLISWQFALIFIVIFLITMLIMFLPQPYLYKEEKKAIDARNKLHRMLDGLVDGLKELTLNTQHKEVYAKTQIGPSSYKYAHHNVNRNKILIIVGKISESFVLISLGLIIVVSRIYFDAGDSSFVQFFILITFTLPYLIRIGLFFSNLKKAEIALDQIDSLGELIRITKEKAKRDGKLQEKDESENSLITLKEISYTYIENRIKPFEVGPYSLEVKENEVLLISGGNGSGKTTLIKLLTGLYIPSNGHIKYRGEEVSVVNLDAYRNLFSAVFADSFVFHDLGYIKHHRVDALVKRYLELLEIKEKLVIDEGIKLVNTNLSFGQMSRLNLFRALLEDKSIYIFDEWAANQDPYFKGKFYKEIIPFLKKDGKTVIIISHDEQYFDVADRRVTATQGQLVENP